MSDYSNIGDMRVAYKAKHETFSEDDLVSGNPVKQFESWFAKVKQCPEIKEPNAMCLATANKDGKPSARFVLLKGYGDAGFTFFTNYKSRKGNELDENPQAALVFYWEVLNRQIRIEGTVSKVPEEESVKYFKLRPFASQVGAAASEQSSIINDRNVLIEKAKEIEKTSNGSVEKPEHWGGYVLKPNLFEFWQGQSDRLHDRICFKKDNDCWNVFRLAP